MDTVVFLMGINDILGNKNLTKELYSKSVQAVCSGCRQNGIHDTPH